jgi:hypothetical protein
MRFLCCVVLMAAACAGLRAADSGEDQAILAAIQKVFDGMAAHDPAAIRAAMVDDARLKPIRGDRPVNSISVDQFLKGIEGNRAKLLERIWDPKVMVRGRLAAVWAEYDFHSDGKFGHCGIDSFLMAKTADGWKITSIAWTAETEGCKPSPLGPPK